MTEHRAEPTRLSSSPNRPYQLNHVQGNVFEKQIYEQLVSQLQKAATVQTHQTVSDRHEISTPRPSRQWLFD